MWGSGKKGSEHLGSYAEYKKKKGHLRNGEFGEIKEEKGTEGEWWVCVCVVFLRKTEEKCVMFLPASSAMEVRQGKRKRKSI